MKNIKNIFAVAFVAMLGLMSCQDDVDAPAISDPVATWTPNMTIEEFKTLYWDDATNYIDTVRLNDAGEHIIIAGRVISSDASGNIYKSLVIQDETAALALSINANSLYTDLRVGQEVVIDVTDMYVGKYNGLQQLGFPEWYAAGNAWEATFMPKEFFLAHSQLNGLPQPDKVNVLNITSADLGTTTANLIKMQSQLVQFDNCHFEDGGKLDFTDGLHETSNRNLILSDGTSIIVRTSGYSNFWDDLLPEGNGTVVGILSFYGTSGWQLLLRSKDDCIGFTSVPEDGGTFEKPYSVGNVINFESTGQGGFGWVSGYIVGAVAPGVSSITTNADIEFSANVSMPNTLVIGPSATEKNFRNCLVVTLPADSEFRSQANLVEHPENYGKAIKVQGTFAKVLGTWGITGNTGTIGEFELIP